MPIEFDEGQTTISLKGDIAVMTFGPDENTHGVAWLVFEEGPPGEPGRDTIREECPEKLEPRMLQDIKGVLIGAKDPRSLDVLIKSLSELRDHLRHGKPEGPLEVTDRHVRKDIEAQEDAAFAAEIEKMAKGMNEPAMAVRGDGAIAVFDLKPDPPENS
jgi:hypothetical protein